MEEDRRCKRRPRQGAFPSFLVAMAESEEQWDQLEVLFEGVLVAIRFLKLDQHLAAPSIDEAYRYIVEVVSRPLARAGNQQEDRRGRLVQIVVFGAAAHEVDFEEDHLASASEVLAYQWSLPCAKRCLTVRPRPKASCLSKRATS